MKPKINPKKLTEALFSVSDENQCLEEVRSSLAFISKLVNSDSHFRMFIQSKKISGSQKADTLNTILAEAGHPLVNETISYLKGSDAVSHLKYISVLFNSIYKKRKNILSVKATIAQKMSENEKKISNSKAEVKSMISKANENAEKNIIKTNEEFHSLMENRKKNAEERIKQMKNQALKDIKNTSVKIAIESVEKLLKNSIDKSKLDKIYLSSIEETKLALKKKSS